LFTSFLTLNILYTRGVAEGGLPPRAGTSTVGYLQRRTPSNTTSEVKNEVNNSLLPKVNE